MKMREEKQDPESSSASSRKGMLTRNFFLGLQPFLRCSAVSSDHYKILGVGGWGLLWTGGHGKVSS